MLAVRFYRMLAMPNYRRALTPGGTWFFTVNLLERRGNDLLVRHIDLLRACVAAERSRRPFAIRAWVVLPEHMHWMWTLPVGDADFPTRLRCIKTDFRAPWRRNGDRPSGSTARTRHLATASLGTPDTRCAFEGSIPG